jgi:hypothetical protein
MKQRLVGFRDVMIHAVMAGAGTVDADETHRRIGSQQYVVPDTEAVIDALLAVDNESA